MIEKIAHWIIVPYLWWFGYDMDEESIQECHDAIEIQHKEEKKKNEN